MNKLQEIFNGLDEQTLEVELERVESEILELQQRKKMIEIALGNQALCLFIDSN